MAGRAKYDSLPIYPHVVHSVMVPLSLIFQLRPHCYQLVGHSYGVFRKLPWYLWDRWATKIHFSCIKTALTISYKSGPRAPHEGRIKVISKWVICFVWFYPDQFCSPYTLFSGIPIPLKTRHMASFRLIFRKPNLLLILTGNYSFLK